MVSRDNMILNDTFNEWHSINILSPFNGGWYSYWKEIFKKIHEAVDIYVWYVAWNGPFILMHFVNNSLVNKPGYLWNI